MSDYGYDDEYSDDNSGGSLRKQLEKALAANKSLQQETATLKSQIAQKTASEALAAKGYAPAVARLAAKDGVDLSNEKALDDWLAENSELFAKPEPQQTQSNEGQNEPDQPNPLHREVEAAYRNIADINAAASPATVNAMKAALDAIPEDATKEQVREFLMTRGL